MTRRFLYRAIGWCTGTIALIAVGLGILLVLMRSELIERVATLDDSILYVAAQSEVDLLRLTTAGQRYVAGDPKMTPDLLRERVDVLYSRVETIVQGDLRQLGATVPEYVTAVQKLKAYLAGIDATWGATVWHVKTKQQGLDEHRGLWHSAGPEVCEPERRG